MSKNNNNGRVRSFVLGRTGEPAIVHINGMAVQFDAQGRIMRSYPSGNTLLTDIPNMDIAAEKIMEKAGLEPLGQITPRGIYIGIWEPKNKDGVSLGKTFDLYAGPTDLKNSNGDNLCLTFHDAVNYVAHLRNWHGYDGTNLHNATAVNYAVLNDPSVLEKWFIPTWAILNGTLYPNREKFTGESAFLSNSNVSGSPYWYWSLTLNGRGDPAAKGFHIEDAKQYVSQDANISTRPVRAELRL